MNVQENILIRAQAFIDGSFCEAATGESFSVTNPYNGEELIRVADCGPEEVAKAVDAAAQAFGSWSRTTALERSRILKRWFDLILTHQEELACLLTLEQGKPLAEARAEIAYGASFVEWFAEEARRVYGDVIPSPSRDKRILVLKQPIGVVAAITPWNFPNAMITRKVAPALAAGCTVVLKPAKLTPLSALALAALAEQAGIPRGVLNVIPSSQASTVGRLLAADQRVRKISFTGSTEVGKTLLAQCADGVKRVSMELGGNAPFIVFDDADLDQAVEGLLASKFRNAGQTCVCSNRIFIQEKIYKNFVTKLTIAMGRLKVGNGLDPEVLIGPVISKNAADFVHELVNDALNKGAELLCGGGIIPEKVNDLLISPALVGGVTPEMRIFKEEIFGPVIPVVKFQDEDEVIALANATPYGLASYFYGREHSRIWRVAEALEFGMVGINTGLISTAEAPFGGVKQSGFGREGSLYGMDDYLNIKYLNWAL